MPNTDYLWEAANEMRPYILMMYRRSEDQRPIILFDIQEQRVYVHAYEEFKSGLSRPSQQLLQQQYEKAAQENQIVVFVRDTDQKRLVSFSMENA